MVQAVQRERPRSTRQAAKAAPSEPQPALDDPRFRPAPEGSEPLTADSADAPARKRRRRRRRSGGGEGAEGGSGGAPGHE
jgi:hypothetical protein